MRANFMYTSLSFMEAMSIRLTITAKKIMPPATPCICLIFLFFIQELISIVRGIANCSIVMIVHTGKYLTGQKKKLMCNRSSRPRMANYCLPISEVVSKLNYSASLSSLTDFFLFRQQYLKPLKIQLIATTIRMSKQE